MPRLYLHDPVCVYESGKEATMPKKFMQPRIDAMRTSPGAFNAMSALQAYVEGSGLERSLLKLVEIRTSQINGCAFCIAMHTKDARKLGERDERMHLLNAWREAPDTAHANAPRSPGRRRLRSSTRNMFPMRSMMKRGESSRKRILSTSPPRSSRSTDGTARQLRSGPPRRSLAQKWPPKGFL